MHNGGTSRMSETKNLLVEKNGFAIQSASRKGDEKSPIVHPVKLTPSWEGTNAPEDELNFRSVSMEPPWDRYNLVYLTFLLHGIGALMPWNMFITAKSYFVEYKLDASYTHQESDYAKLFLNYIGFAAQVPNVIFNWLNIFVQIGGTLTTRIIWSISILVLIFILTIVLAMSDTSEWPGAFFWTTLVSVVVLNVFNGVYQNTVFGMAAKLPFKYTGAVVLGSNVSGAFTAILGILSKFAAPNPRTAAIYYFIVALFVLLVCFDTYFALPLNKFYRHYERLDLKHKTVQHGAKKRVPYFRIFKSAFPQLLNVFLVFFVTLSIFPAVHSDIAPSDPNFVIGEDYYVLTMCFLTFNVCAMIGSSLPSIIKWPTPKYLWVFVLLRFVYLPLFLFCKYLPKDTKRLLPIYIDNDWAYLFIAITMGLTSGHLSALGMMYVPRTVDPPYAATAGMFGAAALISGIFAGIMSSFIWPWFVATFGPGI